jgi:hypothetical protein
LRSATGEGAFESIAVLVHVITRDLVVLDGEMKRELALERPGT